MEEYLLNALSGLLAGFVGGYAGIGGAPILIFFMGAVLGYPQHLAQGTATAILLGPKTLPAVWVMRDRVRSRLRLVLAAACPIAVFSYLGASLAYLFSSSGLRLLFAGLLMAIGACYCLGRLLGARGPDESRRPHLELTTARMAVLGALLGVVGGLFGIGAGILMVPILWWLFGLHKDDARAISLAILAIPVFIGAVIKYHGQGDVNWPMAGVAFAAYLLSNYWGARLGRRHKPEHFKTGMGLVLLVMGVLYALR